MVTSFWFRSDKPRDRSIFPSANVNKSDGRKVTFLVASLCKGKDRISQINLRQWSEGHAGEIGTGHVFVGRVKRITMRDESIFVRAFLTCPSFSEGYSADHLAFTLRLSGHPLLQVHAAVAAFYSRPAMPPSDRLGTGQILKTESLSDLSLLFRGVTQRTISRLLFVSPVTASPGSRRAPSLL